MKITILMLAVLAMIGSAVAWDSTDTLVYEYTHDMYIQAGDPASLFPGTTSQASFLSNGPYGDQEGYVANKLVAASSQETTPSTGLLQQSQTLTLTQGGKAVVATQALDSQDTNAEIAASVTNYQNMHFSGQYTGAGVSAQFFSEGNAGTDMGAENYRLVSTSSPEGGENALPNCNLDVGSVQTRNGATFTEADIGVQSSSGMAVDLVTDNVFLSGSTTAYSSFTGGMLPDTWCSSGGQPVIQTETGDFETDTTWDHNNVYIPTTFVSPNTGCSPFYSW